ncbi:hypothetical protein [Crossiella sp. CA198]|uniref:hypothetical protein n=1 Tax=Crossiella sp. CA198 TaxID=3455607 RepID=UPI003F8D4D57
MTWATVPATPETIKVPCRDVCGRGRSIAVTPLANGDTLLVVPPGEIALLNVLQAHQLRARLRRAVLRSLGQPIDELSCPVSYAITGSNVVVHSTVKCADTVGRERTITVTSQLGEPIKLVSPPGEHALLHPLEVGRLRGTIATAIDISSARPVRLMQAASAGPALPVAG